MAKIRKEEENSALLERVMHRMLNRETNGQIIVGEGLKPHEINYVISQVRRKYPNVGLPTGPERLSLACKARTPDEKAAVGKSLGKSRSHEERVASAAKAVETLGEEGRAAAGRRAHARWENMSPDERKEFIAPMSNSQTPEQRSQAAKKGHAARRRKNQQPK